MNTLPTQEKIDIMQAYMEGVTIAWESGENFGKHNVRNEKSDCSPCWDWSNTIYTIHHDPIKIRKWVNLMKEDGIIGGYYDSKAEAIANSGSWNSVVAVPVVISEIE